MSSDLIEREAALGELRACLRAASAQGRVALVAGEAGIGKTSLLRAMAAEYGASGPVWWGACDALETPHPLGPLLDIARDRRVRFASALEGPRPALFEAVLDELRHAATPVLVVIEDAHWADDATLDLLKFLGRRIERASAVLAISYRDDEVGPSHPLRRVLGELPAAHRTLIEVQPLTPDGVKALATRMGRRADGVYRATRGNAFFATEVLRDSSATRTAVPRSVQDLVLSRFARLPAAVQSLLQLLAIVPGRTERWLVDEVLAPSPEDADRALGSGLLVAEAGALAYRHELARIAIEGALSPPLAQHLHRRVLDALSAPGRTTPPARLVHHAIAADDRAAITRYAPQAAREATERGAHREAGAQWRAALQSGTPHDDAERMEWLRNFANAARNLAWYEEELAALAQLAALARGAGDIERAAIARADQSGPLVSLLKNDASSAAIREAMAMVEPLPPSRAHAYIWSCESWQRMLDRDYADSIAWGKRAMALAESLGDEIVHDFAQVSTGTALLFVDYAMGARMLLDARERRQRRGNLIGVSRVLALIGSGSGELMLLDDAVRYLRESVRISEEHDFDGTYAHAWLSLCLAYRGAWDEASDVATGVLPRVEGANIARLMAQIAIGRMRVRRGDPGVVETLAEVGDMASASGTLQRLAPAACLHAEAAFLAGDADRVRTEVLRVLPLALAKGHPWFVAELSYWLWRLGDPVAPPPGCAEPYALEMAGEWQAAAHAWERIGCPYERGRALAHGDLAAQRSALAIFEQLGARPAAEDLRRRLRRSGVRGLARGAYSASRSHPAGLTNAETQVLAMMCENLRNAEIAARIHRSVRTVDHHVAAVLAKLGVQSRLEAVRRAESEGWVAPPADGNRVRRHKK